MKIRVKVTRDGTDSIRLLELEEYLRGVVPSEMPASWPMEALKAQAVASRTYAMRKIEKRSKYPFDVDDTTNYQAFRLGYSKPTTDLAIEKTKDMYLTYDGAVIDAVFSSSNGGSITSAAERWGGDVPYLIAKPDPFCERKKNGHGVGLSQYGAKEMAERGFNYSDILKFYYYKVELIEPKATLETKPIERPLIRYGSRGSLVEELQIKLNEVGARLKVDGKFGIKTDRALRIFQKQRGIDVDGICGPITWSKFRR